MPSDIEQIDHRRPTNRDVDAIYFLTPQPHIVDSVMADFAKHKYRTSFLIWTSCGLSAISPCGQGAKLCQYSILLCEIG